MVPTSSTPNVKTIAERLTDVRIRIENAAANAGRDASEIGLIAVSKKQPTAALEAALTAGQCDFGENYLQEALPKTEALTATAQTVSPIWHFIGDIQSNKTADIAAHFDWVHTLDRAKIAHRLSEQRPSNALPLEVCIQVNIDQEASKSGVSPDQCAELATIVANLPGLRLRGLMTLPEPRDDFAAQRVPFAELARLRNELNGAGHILDVLSMGMSADLEAAVAEGATHLRIGSAVFGSRPE
ncbi:YggS family pyridoxal phosphate-dependent enzyme [Salinisphaera sp. USBA-960]|nr:YggS family pyridoxal phosphate-dependent enzyme [Salifodinibacter halophilus]NNC26473.1 YggS family pyridoxal phosphate-dependent enzyme [Salifodinibacter halophilus]